MKIKLDKPIIVEGKYDKLRLENIFDAPIITTEGFGIFKNTEKAALIKALARKNGVIILTDSDSAGNVIRGHIKSILPTDKITNVYMPEIAGKERRKSAPSKQGLLGVEGIDDKIIIDAFKKAGITAKKERGEALTKLDLYNMGLVGSADSTQRRKELLKKLELPTSLSTNSLLDAVNTLYTKQEFIELTERKE